ncbi:response regulator transcription factor [Paenibacillus koleovorans]|uniref:response regulator transcription factor n=1 Tax=Paenibacillus koleovorans TaxID=121608 RepID=UPI000FDBF635|nr:response regulator transcription factor [Paenibacillus koleovorans]
MNKIMIIEDDPMIGEMLAMYLTEEGHEVRRSENGTDGLKETLAFDPDIVLLDLVLPDMYGTELCMKLRDSSLVPILVVSMKTEVSERVNALAAGADDFLSKPFSMRELTARISALIRRSQFHRVHAIAHQQTSAAVQSAVESKRHVELDTERRALYVRGLFIETTFSEFELMKLLTQYPNKVFSREELINALRGFESFVTERSIDVHIANLRKKIELEPKEPQYIKTVWGVGYKFQA